MSDLQDALRASLITHGIEVPRVEAECEDKESQTEDLQSQQLEEKENNA